VDRINFSVNKGEIFGFLGPNGAGKTTTIRMLTGLSLPTGGTAIVEGYDVVKNPIEVKKRIGAVTEVSNLYQELTAWDNLLFSAQLYGVPNPGQRLEELFAFFQLEDKKRVHFRKLSKGMKKKLTIAAALAHNPPLLFLDEPTSGLDVVSARGLRALIRNLNLQGTTIFLTTHNIEEADQLCDRIAIIVKGRIVALDTPDNLKSRIRERMSVEISFERISDATLSDLKRLCGVDGMRRVGNKIKFHSNNLGGDIRTIMDCANQTALNIMSINTIRPSLEDAFIQLTGLSKEIMLLEKGRG